MSSRSGPAHTDEELIEAVQIGNDRVAAELHDRLSGVVDRTLLRIFGRREPDHDDLIQAAFEQIVLTLARRTYAGNCSLKTWAARVTSNVGLNALRARRRERAVVDRRTAAPVDSIGSGDLERATHARNQLRKVMLGLSNMNQRRAQAVFLHDIEGYALQEIATITGVTVAAAQSRLVRGRKELLKQLEREEKRHRIAASALRHGASSEDPFEKQESSFAFEQMVEAVPPNDSVPPNSRQRESATQARPPTEHTGNQEGLAPITPLHPRSARTDGGNR